MKSLLYLAGLVAALFLSGAAQAQDRYVERPPVLVSPDLAAPWILQLRRAPVEPHHVQRRVYYVQPQVKHRVVKRRHVIQPHVHTAVVVPKAAPPPERVIDPKFLPQEVVYTGPHKPGMIVVDTHQRFLFLILDGGKARRYGVGVGMPGFQWAGTHTITRKREWPDWRPPAEMIVRERKKGKVLPTYVKGGPHNPLGARALYLGSTLYRIHGTNAPWTIGQAVSSGCIRMRNEDVIDLYRRVHVGTKVVVI
ncbi:L,D-transpeptidase [Chelativorans sp.]|uniref:L,D-transpeptidase n=1 Tax=Chelativorans sp. TaxID=2203393 RepID=UPI00281163A6|nr:L,D-transpeptidase [Chelativorans sp.]